MTVHDFDGKIRGVIAGLVPAISMRMASARFIGMAGTSPAMTGGSSHEPLPLYPVLNC